MFIYSPKGAALEYAVEQSGIYDPTMQITGYACNLMVGCPGACSYCYREKGITRAIIGGSIPRFKTHAGVTLTAEQTYDGFCKELLKFKSEIGNSFLFHTFTSDPGCPEAAELTWRCIKFAAENGVASKTLTKFTDWLNLPIVQEVLTKFPEKLKVGWTLTGMDSCERGAAPNMQRIEAMDFVKRTYGVATWCSFEPVVQPNATLQMIQECARRGCCDEYKIGLLTGEKRAYTQADVIRLKQQVDAMNLPNVYWKKSVWEELNKH